MWRNLMSEMGEIAWLAAVVGGLSVLGVTLAIAAAVVLERVPIAHV
jgi:hypothetical protein